MQEKPLNIGVATTNPNFIQPVVNGMLKEGFKLHQWRYSGNPEQDAFMFGIIEGKIDGWFVDFAQTPLNFMWRLRKPIVVRMHRIEVYQFLHKDNDFEKMNWNNISMIFSCEHVKDKWFKFVKDLGEPTNLKLKTWKVIPTNAVDLKVFHPPEKRERMKRPQMCITGHIIPKKRVYSLIQAMSNLPEWDLNIVGTETGQGNGLAEYKTNCMDLIETLGMQDRIRWLGQITHEAMPGFYGTQDIIVSYSNEEGTHVSIAEAMSCGVKPLVSCWKGAGEIYPRESIFTSETDFIRKVHEWEELSDTDKMVYSEKMSDLAKDNFDAVILGKDNADFIREAITYTSR
jgi:glycosyltransferase involved in cell wall biosynthesis